MYLKKSTADKRHDSLVPERTTASLIPNRKYLDHPTVQLKDNRPKTILEKRFTRFHNIQSSHPIQLTDKRPSFTADSTKSAILHHNTSGEHKFQINEDKPGLPDLNAAQPHRFSWKDIRDNTDKFHKGGSKADFINWTKIFTDAGEERIADIKKRIAQSTHEGKVNKAKLQKKLLSRAEGSQKNFKAAFLKYITNKSADHKTEFLRQANSFHANVPDYGPHRGVNNPVREAMHLHLVDSATRKATATKRPRSPSPMSRNLIDRLDPSQLSTGIAYTGDGRIITTTGEAVPLSDLRPEKKARIDTFPKKVVNSYHEGAAFGSAYKKIPGAKKKIKKTKKK